MKSYHRNCKLKANKEVQLGTKVMKAKKQNEKNMLTHGRGREEKE